MEKEGKALDEFKLWLAENCEEGEVVEILSSPKAFVVHKTKPKR